MIVSSVERQTWKRCRRRWDLTAETRQSYEPQRLAPALQLGGMVQEALSEWTEDPDSDPIKSMALLSQNAIEQEKIKYRNRIGATISEEELDPLYELIDLGMAMVSNYRDYYKTPLPKNFQQIQTEQRTLVHIPDTEHWECGDPREAKSGCGWMLVDFNQIREVYEINQVEFNLDNHEKPFVCPRCHQLKVTWQPHYFRGTIDTLVQDSRGKILPLERKTYGMRPDKKKLQHDDQMLSYYWAVVTLFGYENVGGILYDGLWKRKVPPSTSKSKTTGGKNTIADLFYRDVFIRPPEEVDEFEALLKKEVHDMAYSIMNDLIYINRTWQGCWDCGVERICTALSCGDDAEYVINTFYQKRDWSIQTDEED